MREGGGGVERREWVFKNGGRGNDSGLRVRRWRRVMAEIVLGAWVRVGCREGKIGRRNRR